MAKLTKKHMTLFTEIQHIFHKLIRAASNNNRADFEAAIAELKTLINDEN